MKRAIALTLTAIAFGFIVSCDFPGEPPIKKISHSSPPATLISLQDSTVFKYYVLKELMQTSQEDIKTVLPITAPNGTYYMVLYEYLDFWGGQQEKPKKALPPFLKNDSGGLSFYYPSPDPESKAQVQWFNPVHYYMLPYPANVGASWTHPQGLIKTVLMKKDTLVYTYDGLVGKNCWFYRIYLRVKGSIYDPYIDIFVLLGEYIFKVQHHIENLTVNTLIWKKN